MIMRNNSLFMMMCSS